MIEKTQGATSRSRVSIDDLHRPVRQELGLVHEEFARFFISDVALINEISQHMLEGSGKRLRPTLLLLCNRMGGVTADRRVIVAATIVELVHTATLIHDDSIDKSFLRRGKPTVNNLWNDQTSVIMGDYLYSKAFFLLVEHGLLDVVHMFAHATHRMSLGEMLELEYKLNFDMDEDTYNRLILDKTAVLMAAACELGGYLTWGAESRERETLARFGTQLGMAFQIADDLLDIEGDADTMGKPAGSDIRDGKITLPLIHAIANAPAAVTARIRERMDVPEMDAAAAQEVAAMVGEYGGLDYARRRAREYADDALRLLEGFSPGEARDTLEASVEYVLDRRL